ncbi:hypothetical protein JI664_05495 [Rhodobacter sp. NTK016B]|uniref:hypothetical protein n=1 Tax=Rhodobacter sp. NTK016B TaxID=2759676 RepID=UPI001A8F242C|nr:hypothetical protein [Rhodobacter sp. NTK016B]MBN8291407.1 hypothetical protein [Rhodobacter sp. NTK016B]
MHDLPDLTPDCSACAALCCMALPFDKGEAFAFDKPALHPCPNLSGHACTIHDRLETEGFRGCGLYDCLGAGQRVVGEIFAGADWQNDTSLRAPMAEALTLLHRVHAALELLVAAERLTLPDALASERSALRAAYAPEAGWTPETLRAHAASGLDKRLRAFLASLRAHV